MTKALSEPEKFTPFGKWINRLNYPYNSINFDFNDVDYIWFGFKMAWFITLEEKRYGKNPTDTQKDTFNIISQLLKIASGNVVETMRGRRRIEYRGHYFIVFENTTPEDSQWIKINDIVYQGGKSAVRDAILYLLWNGKLKASSQVNDYSR